MSNIFRVGIAGYGVVGRRRRQFIDIHPKLKTVAVCDKTLGESGVFKDGVKYFSHYSNLLNEDLDILFVCLTNDINPEVTISGLKQGLHVFCEKPPGQNIDDVVRVRTEEEKHPETKLMYGFNHRYHDSVRDTIDILKSGELGSIINLRGIYGKSKLITFGQTNWRTQRRLAGGGVLLDQGIHMVDLIRLFAGDFDEVYSFISNDFWRHDVEDNAYALMRTKSGTVAMLHSSATQWRHQFRLELTLERGALNLSGILSGSKSYGDETLTVIRRADDDMGDPREEITRYNHDPSWENEINEFVDCIDNNIPVTEGSSIEALKTMQLVYRIYCADDDWRLKWGLS
ncbi:MAG: Gfo/Idh/MocA family oxidoreductase [Pseudomonadota bacterium]|nr:Gfo/Idh/MocA family oxidoreductase [Pseudomonadota bacterium]